ncbi:hypothetical protein EDB92DRAFT_1862908 [Lactarius akahatsu]|uniref:CFEM domain-containing protein n=1 Tax=Lactarius akahatsu TaxID=416441 RepID=A0AAD4QDD5_9AGAM|nr:hypothetical protein EDB92DRAFT_1862908 [Lactarius akahatsu]
MRAFLGLFIAAAVSAVSGSYLLSPRQTSPYPQCALDCLAVADLGSCLAGEVECLCKNNTFIVSTTQCFEAKCSASDLATSESIAQQSCAAAGVTLTSSIPPATSTATSPATKPSSTSSSSSPSPSASTSSNSNSAASNAVNIIGGVVALGLTALML